MANQKQFDIIIAGAGAAGLSLLWRIIKSPVLQDREILVIDRSFEPTDDKTWCFWENLDLPDDEIINHSWDHLLVKIDGKTYSEPIKKYQYKCVKSIVFSEFILNEAKKREQVTFRRADIRGFASDNQSGRVYTSNGNFESKNIFQSVLKPPRFEDLKVDISLIQHFLGLEIKSSRNLFDPNVPIFMDFDVPQQNGTSFIYLLPFSKNEALVESTIFSNTLIEKDKYREQIKNYLSLRYGLHKSNYSIKREEFGAIPMEDRKYPEKFCDFVWNIGTVGGFAKPSTGYTFSRIQRHTSEIVKALESNEDIPKSRVSPYRFRVYDLMMLYLLQHERSNSLNVFESLFKKNNFDRVLQFLSEKTTPLQELAIFLKMPYKPFFRSIYKMKHRIFSGA